MLFTGEHAGNDAGATMQTSPFGKVLGAAGERGLTVTISNPCAGYY
jgi:hypothetical protein